MSGQASGSARAAAGVDGASGDADGEQGGCAGAEHALEVGSQKFVGANASSTLLNAKRACRSVRQSSPASEINRSTVSLVARYACIMR